MDITREKTMRIVNYIFAVLIILCIAVMLLPANYSVEYSLYGKDMDKHTLTEVEYSSDSDLERHKADKNNTTVKVPYVAGETFDEMNIYTDTTNIKMAIKWNGVTVKKFSNDIILNNSTVKYDLIDNELPDYSIEELLEKYCDKQYLILMAVSTDYSLGITDSIQQCLNDIGIDSTPRDTGTASSFYAVISEGKLVKTESSNEAALYFKKKIHGHNINLCSGGQYLGNWADIKIDGESYCTHRQGLNIVVYDLKKDCLVDSIGYQNYQESSVFRNTEYLQKPIELIAGKSAFDTINANINIINFLQLVIPCFIAFILTLIWNMIRIVEKSKRTNQMINIVWFVIHQIVMAILLMLAAGLAWGYKYLSNQFEDVSISQLLFHMTTDLGGTNWSDFRDLFFEIGSSIILAIVFVVLLSIFIRKKKWGYRFFASSLIIVIISFGTIGNVFAKFNKNYGLYNYAVASQTKTNLYDVYYVDPSKAKIAFPEHKKNLIYIFLESMEISDSNTENGGGKDTDYISELTDLALNNECFNGTDTHLNGAYPLGNTTWTAAGLVAQTSGVPLNADVNAYGSDDEEFLPGVFSTGQILEQNGYNNCLLIGSDKSFANRGKYFEEHGDFKVYDYNWAIKTHKIPSDYFEWWGYEDEKLFDFAKDTLTELASKGEPFNLTMLTTDTHFTDGYVCDLCENQYDQQYSNVLACNSRQVASFVEWIQQQDFYEDTVIILSGDHLCMDSSYFKDMPDGYDRRTYVNVINSDKKYTGDARTYTTMDMFPTTLSALGCSIEGDRLGLGTDLFSNTETLAEKLGCSAFDYQLKLNSKFYNKNILN